jgi:hypothetical protein
MFPQESTTGLQIDHIQQMTPEDVYNIVDRTHSQESLLSIVRARFASGAHMLNNDDTEPYIEWTPMNRELERWVPILLGKLTHMDLDAKGAQPTVIIGAPNSATPYAEQIRDYGIFLNAEYPRVVRAPRIRELGLENEPYVIIPVRSYVHDRDPKTNERTPHDIAVFTPELLAGSRVLIIDDVIAETVTADEMAKGLRALGALEVYVAAVVSKEIQGGVQKLRNNPYVNSATVLIQVNRTNGKNGPIEFQ